MGCCGRAEIGDDSNHGCDSYAGEPEAGNESYGGEALVDAALREVAEEVGLTLDAESLNKLGTFDAPAANEPGEVVVGTIFTYTRTVTADEPHAAAEIGDTAWVNPAAPDRELAHLLRDRVFPTLA